MPIPVLPTGKTSFAIFSIPILAHPSNPVELPCVSNNISEPVSAKLTKKAESTPLISYCSPAATDVPTHPEHRLLGRDTPGPPTSSASKCPRRPAVRQLPTKRPLFSDLDTTQTGTPANLYFLVATPRKTSGQISIVHPVNAQVHKKYGGLAPRGLPKPVARRAYRLGRGDYRVIYSIDDKDALIDIVTVQGV